jgi:hypothetical protein
MPTRNRATSQHKLPTLGVIAASGTGLTVWCVAAARSYLREHSYRYRVINATEDLIGFAPRPTVLVSSFSIGKSALSARRKAAEVRPRRLPPIALLR